MGKTFHSYLSSLRFDPSLKDTWNAKYLKNIRLIVLIALTVLAVGIASLSTLPKRLNPEVKLTIVTAVTVLPGAGPQDIESLLTIPLEDKLLGVKGLDTLVSTSQESASSIVMQFKSGVDKDKARTDVQTAVSEVTGLPSDAQATKVEALDFEDKPIWTFAITTPTDVASLMRYSQSLKNKIKDLPNIDRVLLSGFETQEIQVVIDQQKLRQYSINPLQLSQAIQVATKAYPAGSVSTDASSFALAVDAQATTIDDIRNIQLFINNQPIRLGDIASVAERSKPDQAKTFLASQNVPEQRSVTFSVYKTSTADIDTTVKSVESFVDADIAKTDGRFHITTITNAGEDITKQFSDLIDEFKSTLILVFINLFLFLGIRQALIASITIPLTFLLSFAWMSLLGQTLNFITLFSLLLAFGTSIDDTIVTVSAMTAYFRTKKFSPMETGLLVWRDLVTPIWTTTVTTVWAFLPLILTTGIIGEFIKPIPVVVATTMYSSTAVAWFITLPLIIVLLRFQLPKRVITFGKVIGSIILFIFLINALPKSMLFIPTLILIGIFIFVFLRIKFTLNKRIQNVFINQAWIRSTIASLRSVVTHGLINTDHLGRKYKEVITRIISSKRGRRVALTCVALFALTAYLLVPLGLVKNEFFPKTNSDIIYTTLEMPSGSTLDTMDQETFDVLKTLRNIPETKSIVAQSQTQLGSNGASSGGGNTVLFTLILNPKEQRVRSSSDIATIVREKFATFMKGKIFVTELSNGPPAGSDVQIKLLGDNLNQLNTYADQVITFLSKVPGTVNVDKSIKSGTSKLVFVPDQAKLAANGVTIDAIGLWLRTSASGLKLDSVKFDSNDSEDVTFYLNNGTLHPEDITEISVPTQSGYIPLSSLGQLRVETNPTVITREGGKRTISVVSDVLSGYSSGEINKKLENYATTSLHLTDGYSWATGGVNEENAKSVASIFRAMGLSFILILATMVIEFRSYRQAMMILTLIPLAISGVFWIFGLTGTPLSFPALIGVLALFGVVVTNAMFIVEKINQNMAKGMGIVHAIADAGQSRLEPIILTSLTSILGLIPITLANPLWRGLGGAIIAGLMFSGAIMLIYIPVMYYVIYHNERA